ncbi:hypothetical protein AMECASPLE_023677 [Ameca splendens]|uniref:Uncharacterized protein n=1 Tax=Ameca splendens TaxID=208324 RepID=A0ABV0YFK6_9TELE
MLDVYIGAWTIQRVPTKTDCLGTCPQRENTVHGLALARNHIPVNLTMHSTVLFPKPWRPRCSTEHAQGPLAAVKHVDMLTCYVSLEMHQSGFPRPIPISAFL